MCITLCIFVYFAYVSHTRSRSHRYTTAPVMTTSLLSWNDVLNTSRQYIVWAARCHVRLRHGTGAARGFSAKPDRIVRLTVRSTVTCLYFIWWTSLADSQGQFMTACRRDQGRGGDQTASAGLRDNSSDLRACLVTSTVEDDIKTRGVISLYAWDLYERDWSSSSSCGKHEHVSESNVVVDRRMAARWVVIRDSGSAATSGFVCGRFPCFEDWEQWHRWNGVGLLDESGSGSRIGGEQRQCASIAVFCQWMDTLYLRGECVSCVRVVIRFLM